MRTENINRKFKLHDERRIAAQLPEQLLGLDVVGFGKPDEFPGELLSAFGEFANGSVAPRSRIYRNAQPNLIDAWLLELLRGGQIGDRFYLRTGLEYFPWADCRVLDHRWLESLRRVLGTNQGFIAHDKSSAVMTIGTQYEVLGFVTGAALPGVADPAPSEEAPTRRIVHAPTVAAVHDLTPAAALIPTPDLSAPATPDLSIPPVAEVLPIPEPVAVAAPEPAPAQAVAPQAAPEPVVAVSAAPADEAPTQLIARIVDPVETD
ncbi:hypothetical protein [Nocardia tengchongensis]|uniref:hypothetical protein n=1 Tax=Nocardia tengchongensis TaxID=2055889 RepID=UPI003621C87F